MCYTFFIQKNLREKLKRAEKKIVEEIKKYSLDFVWKKIEIPLRPIVQEMNQNGFLIDLEKLEKISKKFKIKIKELENEIYALSGETFNIKSTQQLSKVLFEKMQISPKGLKKTPKGVISTKESELQKLLGEHEVIEKILQYREFTKLVSTYLDNLKKLVSEDGRLKTRFLQMGTSTGRMSSKDPNLQNIPTRTPYGREIRSFFIAPDNYSLLSFDYSQIELRVAAILSQDQKLIEIFRKDRDIHSEVAKELFGSDNPDSRRKAKVINFGILYGMGINSLKKNLGENCSTAEAKLYLDRYFEKFQTLALFLEKSKNSVFEKGYSETLFGRKRFFPEIHSKVPFIKASAERMAINAPIQGTATGDIIKLAMIEINDFLRKENLKEEVRFLAQVHDELIFETPDSLVKKVAPKISEIMENILQKSPIEEKYKKVPLRVNFSFGKNWGGLK